MKSTITLIAFLALGAGITLYKSPAPRSEPSNLGSCPWFTPEIAQTQDESENATMYRHCKDCLTGVYRSDDNKCSFCGKEEK
jgi:hypothetical protein